MCQRNPKRNHTVVVTNEHKSGTLKNQVNDNHRSDMQNNYKYDYCEKYDTIVHLDL